MKRLLRLAWLLLIVGVIGAALRPPPDAPGEDHAALQTLFAYPLRAAPRFSIEPGERAIKLMTWLSRPTLWANDPRAGAPYCVRASVTGRDGGERWQGEVWIRARSAWADDLDEGIAPTAVLLEGGHLSTARTWVIDVAGLAPDGGVLALDACHAPAEGYPLVVVHRRADRKATDIYRVLNGALPAVRAYAAGQLGPRPWDELPASWRQTLASESWERLGALPRAAGAVPTVAVGVADEHLAWREAPAIAVPVPPGGAVVYNVQGDVSFEAGWVLEDGRPAGSVAHAVEVVAEDGSVVRTEGAGPRVGPLDLHGVASVRVALSPAAPGSALLRAQLRGEAQDRSWGDPPRVLATDGLTQLVAPDLRSVELWRVSPGDDPLRFDASADERIRLTFRVRLPPGALPGLGAAVAEGGAVVVVTPVDADGAPLDRYEIPAPAVASAYERYTQGDDPTTARVAEPVMAFVRPPPGTVALLVASDGPVDVSARVAIEGRDADRLVADYELAPELGLRGRYVPHLRDRFRVTWPHDPEALARAGRATRVDAQVRLVPRSEGDDPDGGAPRPTHHTLDLPGSFELVAEAPVTDGARVRLSARPAAVPIPASGRLYLDYRVPTSAIGQVIALQVGATTREFTVPTAAGQLRLDDLAPGVARLSTRAPGLLLARGPGAWNVRRVHRLAPGAAHVVAVPDGEASLIAHVYAAPGALDPGAELTWSLEGAFRPGWYDAITEPVGRRALVAEDGEALPLSVAGASLGRFEGVRVALGADRAPGADELRLAIRGASGPVWVRYTASWAPPPAPDDRHWRLGPSR